jgi:oxidase EvaA
MAERACLDWFRERLAASRAIEPRDPAPILAWRETHRRSIRFKSELIGIDQVRDWSRDEHGNIRHKSGQFFKIEGARVEGGDVREVTSWDQPIMTQSDGGLLGMLARGNPGERR